MRMLRVIDSLESYIEGYRRKHHFELGEMYITDTTVVFVIEGEHKKLFENGVNTIKNLEYDSDDMKKEMSRFLPSIVKTFEAENHSILILNKNPDLVRLRDLFDYFKGNLDPKHTAWILSSLYNLACYFNFIKLSHNDISLDTYFVSPEYHGGVLLGGWWYAVGFGKKMLGAPSRTFNLLPLDVKNKKGGDSRVDLDLIRTVGRELSDSNSVPKPMADWLKWESKGNAIEDYSTWKNEVIMASFGGRFFTEMGVTAKQIYKT